MNRPSIPATTLKKLKDPSWMLPVVLGLLGTVWTIGQLYADLQTKNDVKEAMAPLVKDTDELEAKVDKNQSEYTGFKVNINREMGSLATNVDNLAAQQTQQGEKLDKLIIITVEQRELARPQVDSQTRARARRTAARVRDALEKDEDDPLGGL